MEQEERKTLKTFLLSEDLDFVDQGLLLWESLIINFSDFLEDLRAITNRKDSSFYQKKKLLNFQHLKKLFQHFHHRGYLAAWVFGILCSFDQFQDQKKWLFSLDLSSSRLSRLPESLKYCETPSSVFLQGNSFSSKEELSDLFEILNGFPRLRKLRLSNNLITELPKKIEDLANLEVLNLSKNLIKELPKEIGNLERLISLKLKDNHLQMLPESIENLQGLRHLNLSENIFYHHPEFLKKLPYCKVFWRGNPYQPPPPSIKELFPHVKHKRQISRIWEWLLYLIIFLLALNCPSQ